MSSNKQRCGRSAPDPPARLQAAVRVWGVFLEGVYMAHINSDILRLGVDVGSTTVKAVALDPADNSVLFTRYQRHNAHQADTVRQLLEEVAGHFPGMPVPYRRVRVRRTAHCRPPWGPAMSRRWWPTRRQSGPCIRRSAPRWNWADRMQGDLLPL